MFENKIIHISSQGVIIFLWLTQTSKIDDQNYHRLIHNLRNHYGGSPTERGRSPSAGTTTGLFFKNCNSIIVDICNSIIHTYLHLSPLHVYKLPLQADKTGRQSTLNEAKKDQTM